MPISAAEAWEVFRGAQCLHSSDAVEAALDRMGAAISAALAELNPIAVCIMSGAVVTLGKLLPRMKFPLRIDYVHATRYGDKLHGGQLQWLVGPSLDPRGETILLVDDILDEGETLAGIERRFIADGARAVHKAVLVVKNRKRTREVAVDYVGLTVPDRYVFGYGMDYKGYLRNVPGIYAVG